MLKFKAPESLRVWARYTLVDTLCYLLAFLMVFFLRNPVIRNHHYWGFLTTMGVTAVLLRLIPIRTVRNTLVAFVTGMVFVALIKTVFGSSFLNDAESIPSWWRLSGVAIQEGLWENFFKGLGYIVTKAYLGALFLDYLFCSFFQVTYPDYGVPYAFGKSPWRYWMRNGIHPKLGRISLIPFYHGRFGRVEEKRDGKVVSVIKEGIPLSWQLETAVIVDGSIGTAEQDLIDQPDMRDEQKRRDALSTSWVMSSGSLAAGVVSSKLDLSMGIETRMIADPTAMTADPIAFLAQTPKMQKAWWTGTLNEMAEIHRELVSDLPLRVMSRIDSQSLAWGRVSDMIDFIFAYLDAHDPDRDHNTLTRREIRTIWAEYRKCFRVPEKADLTDESGRWSLDKWHEALQREVEAMPYRLGEKPVDTTLVVSPEQATELIADAKFMTIGFPTGEEREISRRESLAFMSRSYGQALFANRVIDIDIPQKVRDAIEEAAVQAQKREAELTAGQAVYHKANAIVSAINPGLSAADIADDVLELVKMFIAQQTFSDKDKIVISSGGLEETLTGIYKGLSK